MAEGVEILMLLYPWYKKEVYHRRQQMIWLTVVAAFALVLLLCLVPVLPAPLLGHRTWSVFVIVGVLLFSGAMIYGIRQQGVRHRMAKRILIKLEQALGLYEEDRFLADASLYPQNWQTAWRQDFSEWIYLGIILLLTALVVSALLLR
jgi:hypothetical protein